MAPLTPAAVPRTTMIESLGLPHSSRLVLWDVTDTKQEVVAQFSELRDLALQHFREVIGFMPQEGDETTKPQNYHG
eukprot:4545421-Amphidinium_carterae.1